MRTAELPADPARAVAPEADADAAPALEFAAISRAFGALRAVDDVTLDVRRGELLSILGPSGSGKTTLLRLVAGFESPDRGSVRVGGRTVAADGVWVEPEHRAVGLVPQGDSLFPHLTVRENVEFGVRREPERAREALDLVGLAGLADRSPGQLSGGERQRVALARALAPQPSVVLLDEPFSALDAALRDRLRRDVVEVLRRAQATAVLVTHDQEEALTLADRVAVIHAGRVTQCATPSELYWQPADLWTARFLGEVNVLPAVADATGVVTAIGRFAVPAWAPRSGSCEVGVRPEALTLEPLDPGGAGGSADAVVASREFRGRDALYGVRHSGLGNVLVRTSSLARFEPGDLVRIAVHPRAWAVPLSAGS